jgi:hypothetical protein
MTKTKYEVYRHTSISAIYVTTTRNCEDMIQEIRKKHEMPLKHSIYPNKIRIVRVVNGERKLVYTIFNKKFWEKDLVVTKNSTTFVS